MHVVRPSTSQRGATLVMVALWMGIALATLMVLDIGNLFWQKRELQKIADLSALAGAQQPVTDACSERATSNAHQIAVANGWGSGQDAITVKPGAWQPVQGKALEEFFTPMAPSQATQINACHVEVRRLVPYLFFLSTMASSRLISAKATALVSATPMATVAIRSTLASVNGGALNALLSAVLGSNVQVSAVGWQGIAKLNVNLLKVFDHLIELNPSIGGYEELLQADIRVAQLLKAMVVAVEPGQFIAADLAALNQVASLGWGNVFVRLGDLIQLRNVEPSAGLNLGVNALELLQGSLQLAAKDHAIELNLGIPGLAAVKLKVIEPSQLAIIGNPLDDTITIEARTAQVRLWIAVSSPLSFLVSALDSVLNSVLNLVTGLLSALGLGWQVKVESQLAAVLELDLLVDVARGYARVEDVDCTSATHSMQIQVKKALVDIYAGRLVGSTSTQKASNAFGPSIPAVNPILLVDVKKRFCVLACTSYEDAGNIKLGGHLTVAAQQQMASFSGEQLNQFRAVEDASHARIYHKVLSQSVQSISGLLKGAALIQVNLDGAGNDSKINLVSVLLNQILTPLLTILDPLAPLLDGLLGALGVHINQIEVAPYLQCSSTAELVY